MDVEELKQRASRKENLKFLFFWGHQRRPDGQVSASCFSQWYAASFEVDGVIYATAEHYMMAEKARLFDDLETRQEILGAGSPAQAKALGRKVRGFDDARWTDKRFEIVVNANLAKFGQNEALRSFLLKTGEKILVEASPSDRIWGIGLSAKDSGAGNPHQWRGLNLLGFALMDVRESLRKPQSQE